MAVRTGWFRAVAAAAAMAVTAAAAVLAGAGVGSAAAVVPAAAAPAAAVPAVVPALAPAVPADACGASPARPATAAPAEPGPSSVVGAAVAAAGRSSTGTIAYRQPAQLPIGLWSAAAVTLRAPAGHGTVRLDLTSKGFSTDSMEVQRWVPSARRWLDLASSSSDADFPTHGGFSFTLTTPVGPGTALPQTVALRLQDLDRPGSLAVAASYTDSHRHTSRAAVLTSTVTRPQTVFSGWPAHAALVRGGAPQPFTMTVRNTTDRAYPAVSSLFYAYGMGGGHALTPLDLVLEQYRAGTGWTRLPLVASPCDPGLSVPLSPAAGIPLAPGAGETVQLRLAVAATAPAAVTSAEAGLSVQSGDTTLASAALPFAVSAAGAPAPVTAPSPGADTQRR